MLGFEVTKYSKSLYSNSNRRSPLGSGVICDYPELLNLVKKVPHMERLVS